MALSKRYLISWLLMARPRKKCLCLVLTSIILYVVGGFIWLHIHIQHNELLKFPTSSSSIVGTKELNSIDSSSIVGREEVNSLAKADRLHLTWTSDETYVKQEEYIDDTDTVNESASVGAHHSDNDSRKSPDIETKIINNTNIESYHSSPLRQGPRLKFLYVFRYSEQLGRVTSNLLDLASFAKNKNRRLVIPYVNNSRMSGLFFGASHFFRKKENPLPRTYALLSEYFNVEDLNSKLKARGYSTFNSFDDLEYHCANRFDIVVHFLFNHEIFKKDAALWYGVREIEAAAMYKKARRYDGWIDCSSVMKRSLLSPMKRIDFRVTRYVCVDPEIIRTASDLEEKILKGASCVGVLHWRGTGDDRVHFPLDPSIRKPLRPIDVEFNPHLIELARNFVKSKFKGDFIGVHVRSERHIDRKGVNATEQCMLKLAIRVQEYGIEQVFLASDLTNYGSDTLMKVAGTNDRQSLSLFLHKILNHPETFKPNGVLYDTGAAAIVEMNILSMATELFTLGGGTFQEWAVGVFRKRHNYERGRVHRMCELELVKFGDGRRGKNYTAVRILPPKKTVTKLKRSKRSRVRRINF